MRVFWTATSILCIEEIIAFTSHNISKDLAERYHLQIYEVEDFFKGEVKIQFKVVKNKYFKTPVYEFIHNGFRYSYTIKDASVYFIEVYFA
jgi:hypothetical protein